MGWKMQTLMSLNRLLSQISTNPLFHCSTSYVMAGLPPSAGCWLGVTTTVTRRRVSVR